MTDVRTPGAHLSPLDAANLLAGQAVAAATSFLDGRSDDRALLIEMNRIELGVLQLTAAPGTGPLIKLVRILVVVCKGIIDAGAEAAADGAALNMRDLWQDIARDAVRAIRYKSWMLCGGDTPAPDVDAIDATTKAAGEALRREQLRAELAQLEAANADAPEWGAAVGARQERINAIRRALAGAEPRG
ncbi:hypothetical protein [Bradyrhizobium sp. SZCCHNS3002]|uniref:hypothetical protein n=1 Tax=Bradyrhizobium sp. SZCCHNS3002 TaxID=3057310 RepID=UPI0028E50C8A|nr:hypothetical protein [Bradyrhizobium sp. SZCCHNS3002]